MVQRRHRRMDRNRGRGRWGCNAERGSGAPRVREDRARQARRHVRARSFPRKVSDGLSIRVRRLGRTGDSDSLSIRERTRIAGCPTLHPSRWTASRARQSLRVFLSIPGRSESIRVAPNRSESLRVDQSRSESLRVAPSRSESLRVGQCRSKSISAAPCLLRVAPSRTRLGAARCAETIGTTQIRLG